MIVRAAGDAEFLQGDAALGLEPDIDDRNVLLDGDDGALDDTTFLKRRSAERLFKESGELIAARMANAGLRLGHLGSYSPSHHTLCSSVACVTRSRATTRISSPRQRSQARSRMSRMHGYLASACSPAENLEKVMCQCEMGMASNGLPGMAQSQHRSDSMAALNAASISKFVVSSKAASSAWTRGAAARFSSRSSRRWISARTSASVIRASGLAELAEAAACALLGSGGDEQLHVGVGANDRADVAAVEHGAGLLPGEGPLIGEQRLPHLRMAGDHDGAASPRRCGAQGGSAKRRGVERLGRDGGCRACIVRVGATRQGVARHGAIERAGIEMGEAVMGGDRACRACPCPRRPVRQWR